MDPKIVLEAIEKIFDNRRDIYLKAPFPVEIKTEITKKKCENPLCFQMHDVVVITPNAMLREELSKICEYTKKNGLGFLYKDGSFYVILS